MGSLIIRNAMVVSSKGIKKADVLVQRGRIKAVEDHIDHAAGTEIDATGLHLLPGVLDPQVHFRDPGMEWKEDWTTASRAAASGGVTGVFEMPNTIPNAIDAQTIADKKKIASEKSIINYNFFIGATPDNLDELNNTPNVCGIKIFMGSSTGTLLVHKAEDLERIFANGTRLIAVHAENEEMVRNNMETYKDSTDVADHEKIRSVDAAVMASRQAISLSRRFQRRLHILHMTTADEVQILRDEKRGGPISAEVCPQHFLLQSPEVYEELGTMGQMNPPIRSKEHGEGLWQGLKDGIIDCIATDHAPHTLEEKQQPYGKAPSGMPGVETVLPMMLNRVNEGLCTLEEVVLWMCERPVELYSVLHKGHVAPGFDADLVLVDMNKSKMIENGKLHTKSNWSPFNGRTTKGWPVKTFVNGNLVFDNGVFFEEIKGKEIKIDG